jgi:hypothetical protein
MPMHKLVTASTAAAPSPATPGMRVATLRLSTFPLASDIVASRGDIAPSGRQCRISAWQCGRAAAHPSISLQAEIHSRLFRARVLENRFGGIGESRLRVRDVLGETVGNHLVRSP